MPTNQTQQSLGIRPGAMTTAMRAVSFKSSGPKVLRIGVIQSERIVEDRIIRARATVTIGSSETNDFVINADGLPTRFELFQPVGGAYVLNCTDTMKGRVGLPGSVQDLAQLRSGGAGKGACFQVKLDDNSRGKIVVGEITLLFQFVALPSVQPRPQLPAAARAGFVRRIDWLFTAFVMFSFMSAFGFLVYLENYDAKVEQGIAAVPDAIAEIVFAQMPPPVEPIVEPQIDPVTELDGDPSAKPDPNVDQRSPSHEPKEHSPSSAERDTLLAEQVARLRQEAAQQAEALIVGALSAEAGGVLANVLAAGAVTGGAEEIFSQVNGVGVAHSHAGGELRTRSGGGDGSGHGNDLGSLARVGVAAATAQRDEGDVLRERAVGETKLAKGGDIGGTGEFDAATVVSMIKIKMGAIKACYERSLRQNPTVAGKVTIEFTIVPVGTVTAPTIVANTTGDEAVGQCVVATIQTLRFKPGPVGGSVVYSYPFVFAPMN